MLHHDQPLQVARRIEAFVAQMKRTSP